MESTELNWRSLPERTKSIHLMLRCLYFSGRRLETPAPSLPPVTLDLIRWRDAVSIPFIWILYLSFDLLYVLLPIECMLLIAVFSSIKRAFFCRFPFFFSFLQTHDWCVQCETVLCFSLTESSFLSGRLAFLSSDTARTSNMFSVKLCLRVWCFVDEW